MFEQMHIIIIFNYKYLLERNKIKIEVVYTLSNKNANMFFTRYILTH